MIWRTLLVLVLLPSFALAQDFKGYRTTTLDAVIEKWNGITKSESPGFSISRPEKIKFAAAIRAAPVSCGNTPLAIVLKMLGSDELLKQVSVTHCVTFASATGRSVIAFVQDALVPGMNSDAGIGRSVDIYADFLAYQVSGDRARNTPILLVNRFEPR